MDTIPRWGTKSPLHYYQESLALGRELADRYTTSIALSSLGITAFQEGNLKEADDYYQESMALSRALGHKVNLSLIHCYLGLLALARNQINSAREFFQEGLTIAFESNMRAYVVYNLIGYACVDLAENTPTRAATLLGAAAANAAAIGLRIEPELQRPYDLALQTAKEGMSEADFHAQWEMGRKMLLEDAVKLARTSMA